MKEGTKVKLTIDVDKINDKFEEITGTDNFNVPQTGILPLEKAKDGLTIGYRDFIVGFALTEMEKDAGRAFELVANEEKSEAWIIPTCLIEPK